MRAPALPRPRFIPTPSLSHPGLPVGSPDCSGSDQHSPRPLVLCWWLASSLPPLLCPVPPLPSCSRGGEGGLSPLPLLFTPGIPKATLDGAGKGHRTSLQYRTPGRVAGRQPGRREDPTPSGPNDKPVSLLPGLPGCSLNLGSPIFLPTPRPAPEPGTCPAGGKSQMPLKIDLQLQ